MYSLLSSVVDGLDINYGGQRTSLHLTGLDVAHNDQTLQTLICDALIGFLHGRSLALVFVNSLLALYDGPLGG